MVSFRTDTTGVVAKIYPLGVDPVLTNRVQTPIVLAGRRSQNTNGMQIMSCAISKMMSAAATFSIQIKQPFWDVPLDELVIDDDWIDIDLIEFGDSFHRFRGTIDTITEDESATTATVRVWTVVGRGFQKQLELTPIMYLNFFGEIATSAAINVFGGPNYGGPPDNVVKAHLYDFSKSLQSTASRWELPVIMPNGGAEFIDLLKYNAMEFNNSPARQAISTALMTPKGNAWSLAKQWSDPLFCELFTELLPGGDPNSKKLEGPFGADETVMTVVYRDRPFYWRGDPFGRWDALRVTTVPREYIESRSISRGGMERYNAFFVSPPLVQETMSIGAVELQKPMVNNDTFHHGFRRFDVETKYSLIGSDQNYQTGLTEMRKKLIDWYAINPYLWSGSIEFAHGVPGVTLGSRLKIESDGARREEHYYIEGWEHAWTLLGGVKTAVTVTRGWKGTDAEYKAAVGKLADTFEEAFQRGPEIDFSRYSGFDEFSDIEVSG